MTADPTKKIILTVSFFCLIFLGILFGILAPTLIRIKKTSQESLKLRIFLEQKYQESLNSRITRKKLSEIKEATADFDRFIFKPGEELELITFLETSAAKHDVVQTITASNLDQISNNRLATISINLKGNYYDILNYITDLETSDYFINIDQLQITPVFSKEGQVTQTANLNISTELYVTE
ncbi:MAG: hypothetical protein HYT15_04415 [Candidatus Magasanikbacteria bacterium]|nr:hypothetical protein [Candidatus Magasanikbacteria bacterium]